MESKITGIGLELLRQREKETRGLDELKNRLPPKMSLFAGYYVIGDFTEMFSSRGGKVLLPKLPKINTKYAGAKQIHCFTNKVFFEEEYDGYFNKLYSCEKIINELNNYDQNEGDWDEYGLIEIGRMVASDYILLGVEDHNRDEIWVDDTAFDSEDPIKFSNDIFDFFSSFTEEWSDETIKSYTKSQFTGKDVYKNWGEDFWQIRDTRDKK